MADRMLCLALGVSIFGLALIAYISPSIKPPMSYVGDITASSVDKVVRFGGRVREIHVFKGGSMIVTVGDGLSDVDVFIPYSVASGYNRTMLDGRDVEVSGTVQVYNGRLEVVADKPGSVVVT